MNSKISEVTKDVRVPIGLWEMSYSKFEFVVHVSTVDSHQLDWKFWPGVDGKVVTNEGEGIL
jgi:hypothetical protein